MRKELEYARMYDASIAVALLGVRANDLPFDLQYLLMNASVTEISGEQYEDMVNVASLVGHTLLNKGETE